MTNEKLLEVIEIYRTKFRDMGIPKKEFPQGSLPSKDDEMLSHCHAMLDIMEVFVAQGRTGKASRWLGFIQGCLFATGVYSINEMKNHSRP